MNRAVMFYWSQLVAAGVLALIAGAGWIVMAIDEYNLLLSIHGLINVVYVLPGLILSLLVNHLVLRARKAVVVKPAEQVVLTIEYASLVLLFALWPVQDAVWLMMAIWPAIIIIAIVACTIISVHTGRIRAEARATTSAVSAGPGASFPVG